MQALIRMTALALLWVALGGWASAQLPEKFTNLKVLPADITRAELVETMKGFTRALGVRCTACHVGEEGKPLTTYDFAADSKPMKLNARVMLLMVQEINQKSISKVQLSTGEKAVTVTCYTCHRGQRQPETKPAAPPTPGTAPPAKPGS